MESEDRTPISVAIVDDHPILSHGLVALLKPCDDICVTRIVASARDVLPDAAEYAADVLIISLVAGRESPVESIRAICAHAPSSKIIVIACSPEPRLVRESLKAGAISFLSMDASPIELQQAVRSAYQGDAFFSQEVLASLLDTPAAFTLAAPPSSGARLTARECDVLKLIGQGLTNAEVAAALHISKSTVQFHVHNLLRKLKASTRAEAAVLAERLHLITSTG